ncbi:hypothetical protein E2C01_057701 [Portunus trituberculatus]|uniref:Uncharacterized protein n=1 Tax=Portunus trituberculatus TaxID=210409 RepID=A0A5B7GXR1_PORTR|nr:hypothetical protein [Portunus trituberculatus]
MLRSTERSWDGFGHAGTGWRRVKRAPGHSGGPGQVDETGVGWSVLHGETRLMEPGRPRGRLSMSLRPGCVASQWRQTVTMPGRFWKDEGREGEKGGGREEGRQTAVMGDRCPCPASRGVTLVTDITSIKLFNGALPMARRPRGRQLRGPAQPDEAHIGLRLHLYSATLITGAARPPSLAVEPRHRRLNVFLHLRDVCGVGGGARGGGEVLRTHFTASRGTLDQVEATQDSRFNAHFSFVLISNPEMP